MSEFTTIIGGREETFAVGGWCEREALRASAPIEAALGGDEGAAQAMRAGDDVLKRLLADPKSAAEASALRSVAGELFLKKLRELQEVASAYASLAPIGSTPDNLEEAAEEVSRLLPKLSERARRAVEETSAELERLEHMEVPGGERERWQAALKQIKNVGGAGEKIAATYRVLAEELA